jgi:hypothetical protein
LLKIPKPASLRSRVHGWTKRKPRRLSKRLKIHSLWRQGKAPAKRQSEAEAEAATAIVPRSADQSPKAEKVSESEETLEELNLDESALGEEEEELSEQKDDGTR